MDVSLNSEISADNIEFDSNVKINDISTENKNVINPEDLPVGNSVADCSKNVSENGFNTLASENEARNITNVNIKNYPSSSSCGDEDLPAMCKIAEDVDCTLDVNANSSFLSEQNSFRTDDASQQVSKIVTDKKENCATAGLRYIFDKQNVNQISNIYRDFIYKSGKENFLKGCKCFASSSAKEPVHLWDAYTGELRASYKIHNYAEEVVSALSLNFSPDGVKLFCGFKNNVDVFNVQYSGIKPVTFNIKALGDQLGLVSTIAVNPYLTELFAVGTYQKTVGLYCERDKCAICIFSGHSGGLTHMLFSPDGSRLYTGSRMDPEIVCWDLRYPGKVLFSLCRTVTTNQRIYFDLTPDGKTLVSGNTDGNISVWDLENNKIENGDNGPALPDFSFRAHKDCSNGVSINQCYNLLATSSGQRHFPDLTGDCDDEDAVNIDSSENDIISEDSIKSGEIFDFSSLNNKVENCVKLWWVGPAN
ncbi:telomerase Cajal body protein 1 homolog isoform X2 [Lycorma delicatula]|uniref:telomerase Cajal body protein 1 homolog isoform X2 n=1 Tax=Lycorma delicatula TaxID=130591 RepID=UPI003F519527